MPQSKLAFTGLQNIPPALVAGGVLLMFVAAQYWWERRKRFELRRSLERLHSPSLTNSPAGTTAAAAFSRDWHSVSDRGGGVSRMSRPFPAFGHFLLAHLGRYALALLFVGVALWVRWLLEPSLQGRLQYGFFLLAAVATALVTGIWETLMALAVGFLVAGWYFVDPPGFQIAGAHGWWGAILYILTGGGVLWFLRSEHTNWLRAFERDIAYFGRLKELDRERAVTQYPAEYEMLVSIVDTAPDAIMSLKPDGQIATWNAAAQRLLGYSAGEAVGQPLALILSPEQRAEQESLLQRITRGARSELCPATLCSKGGVSIAATLAISPLTDRSGVLIGSSLIVRSRPVQG